MALGDYLSCKVCKMTGKRYMIEGRLKYGRMYYSCDAWTTQETSKAAAKAAAVGRGSMLWMPAREQAARVAGNNIGDL